MNADHKATLDTLNWLRETFPLIFMMHKHQPYPLKIGIGIDILKFRETNNIDVFSPILIKNALRTYTNSEKYLIESAKIGANRIDLDGCNRIANKETKKIGNQCN